MKETVVITVEVGQGVDRDDVQGVSGCGFDTVQDVRGSFPPNCEVGVYTLSDFADACNDTDSDATYIDTSNMWIGYAYVDKI